MWGSEQCETPRQENSFRVCCIQQIEMLVIEVRCDVCRDLKTSLELKK